MDIPAGTRFGPYEIVAPLGAGGMGEVYRARDTRLDRTVALKVLPAAFAADPDRVRRFEQEARAAGRLNHPNILALYDVGRVPADLPRAGAPFLVTELLEGHRLRDELAGAPLPARTALAYARDVAEGLAAAHDKDIVHRDLKPENLFVTRDGRVKILDFGLAKLREQPDASAGITATAGGTRPGEVMGTTAYMSPEQVRGQPVDHRSDIFSFGSVLYEMLTGRRPFGGDTAADTMSAILRADPPPMRGGPAAPVPLAIERLVERCLAKAPERRIQSARDLVFSLETLSEVSGVAPATGAPAPAGRRWIPAIVAGLALVGLAAVAAWVATRGGSPDTTAPPAAPPTVAPLIAGDAVEALPAWSPTANLLAYVSDAAGNDDIWISDVAGASPLNLTAAHAGVDTFPAWAPDGQRIAFYSERDGGGIFTMSALGADVRKVVDVPPSVVYTFSLQWAPDGSIVYTNFDANGQKQVYRTSPAGADPSCLTCALDRAGARAGQVSPSGTLLAHVGPSIGPRAALTVIVLATGQAQPIVELADNPRWIDDGRLVFISVRDGAPDLWEVEIDPATGRRRGDARRITSSLNVASFAVSADGRRVLATTERVVSTLWWAPTSAARVPSLSQATALTTGEFRDARPRWSADEREIFFESNRRGSLDIWKVSAAGGPPVRVTSAPDNESRPRPSPDGRFVAFDQHGNWTWLMRPDGSQAREAADWKPRFSHVCCGAWSPDGTRLALSLTRSDGSSALGIGSLDPAGGPMTDIQVWDAPGGSEEYARWSPDGRFLSYEAFSDASWNLWVVDSAWQRPVRVTHDRDNERSSAWQSDPLFLYFVRDYRGIWRMPMTDPVTPAGPPVPWLVLPGWRVMPDGLDVSRDGRRIVFALARPESDIQLVERR